MHLIVTFVRRNSCTCVFIYLDSFVIILQEDKDFDEVRDEGSSDEEEGVEADTTMTLQGGVRQSVFVFCSFVSAHTLPSFPPPPPAS